MSWYSGLSLEITVPRLDDRDRLTKTTAGRGDAPWKRHRLQGTVTLEQIEESTKISKNFLRAIESAEFGDLPGGLFTKSYIRQYAALIGYDGEEILSRAGLKQGGAGLDGAQGGQGAAVLARAPRAAGKWAWLFSLGAGEKG